MTPQELKNSILQLAIQGKLVEQRPEEGYRHTYNMDIILLRMKTGALRWYELGISKKEKYYGILFLIARLKRMIFLHTFWRQMISSSQEQAVQLVSLIW